MQLLWSTDYWTYGMEKILNPTHALMQIVIYYFIKPCDETVSYVENVHALHPPNN